MRRCALGVLLLLLALAVPAAARELIIESFDVAVTVFPDGSIEVTETIRPHFTGAWNGIIRDIPVEYRTPQGFNYDLVLHLESITDEAGTPLRYETSRARHYLELKVWVPGASDATRTLVFRYRVENGLKFFEEHDELYWNVTGDEWEIPIQAASARILLPAAATGVRSVAFTGGYGSREQAADISVEGTEVRVRMRRALGFREGLTVAVAWNPGVVQRPSVASKIGLFLRSNWLLFVPLGVFVVMFWLWHTRGRDPRLRPITAQYAPPEGLTPAELGTLVDNSPDMRDVTASLVDLAVRGYLRIEEKQEEQLLGLWTNKEYVFHLRKTYSDAKDLKPHERQLLESLFQGRESSTTPGSLASVPLSELENKFYKDLPGIRDAIFDQLTGRGYYGSRPDKVKKLYVIAGGVAIGLSIWGGGAVSAALGLAPLTFIVSGLLTGAIIVGFGWFMPKRTLAGARALESVLGFEEFLSRVESDRFARMVKTPEMFEKFLPFAMALGVERNWVRAFEDIYRRPPEWYQGTSMQNFRPSGFVSDLGRMSSRAASTMASSPRSSGGSGFGGGGGGFSGGGFGGGGGRGF